MCIFERKKCSIYTTDWNKDTENIGVHFIHLIIKIYIHTVEILRMRNKISNKLENNREITNGLEKTRIDREVRERERESEDNVSRPCPLYLTHRLPYYFFFFRFRK